MNNTAQGLTDNKLNPPICLSIAGSDSCSGAGIQADIKTFAALNCYGVSAITASTAQSHQGINDIHVLPIEHLKAQLQTLSEHYKISVIKTGLIANADQARAICEFIKGYPQISLVVDPVLSSSSGTTWSSKDQLDVIVNELFPLASIVTPNIPEFLTLFKDAPHHNLSPAEYLKAYVDEHEVAVLIKGGHAEPTGELDDNVHDALHMPNKRDATCFSHPRIKTINDHGTGCTLSSAIAAFLAHGYSLELAIEKALIYLGDVIEKSVGFINQQSSAPLHNLPMQHFLEK